jgi:hypothetical protein
MDRANLHYKSVTFQESYVTSMVPSRTQQESEMYCTCQLCNTTYSASRSYNGWTLGGDKDSIWLTKDEMKIEFDIKIPTTKGMLFTMYHERDTEKANAGTTQDQDK